MDNHGKLVALRKIRSDEKKDFHTMVTQSYASKFWYGDEGDKRTEEEFFTHWNDGIFDENKPLEGQCFWILADETRIGAINYNKIDTDDKKCEIDILIADQENHGKGYGPDAIKALYTFLFTEFKLNKIWVEVRAFNIGSVKAFEKAGFKKEGLLRSETFFNHEFIDCVRLGLLREDRV